MKALKEEATFILSQSERFGPDPVLMKKIGAQGDGERDLSFYKQKILDDDYIDHAINRIAMELSHFLSR